MRTVGVTTGVGHPYSVLAPLAAACFTKQTGIPAVVLGEKEFISSGLQHPAALRLHVVNYITADRIVYFDADWLCLQPWTPTMCECHELGACRDFILVDEWPRQFYDFESRTFLEEPGQLRLAEDQIRHDYVNGVRAFASIMLPSHLWINTGLLIIHRDYHAAWLARGLQLYLGEVGHHGEYFEQPALMKALESVKVSVRFLPRKMNVLAAYERKWPASVVGLHIKLKRHSAFIAAVQAGAIGAPDEVVTYFRETSPLEEK